MRMRSFQVCQCGAPLQMNEAEAPKPQGTQVLLKMLAAGVCHSDLHIWDGYYEIGGGKKLMLADNYLTVEPYALALPHGDEDFRLAVDRALSHLYRDGGITKIFAESFKGQMEPSGILKTLYLITGLPD